MLYHSQAALQWLFALASYVSILVLMTRGMAAEACSTPEKHVVCMEKIKGEGNAQKNSSNQNIEYAHYHYRHLYNSYSSSSSAHLTSLH